MNIEKEFNNLKKNVARTVGIGLIAVAPMLVIDSGSAHAQVGGPVTSSEEPLIPEPGKEYQVIIDEGVWLANDEIRRLMALGLYDIGDCIKVTEMLDPNSVLTGGPITYRHLFSRCEVLAKPTPTSILLTPNCTNLEVPLGTSSGNGATTNDYTATEEVIVHGDVWINGEFRADDNGATGLVQRVHATPANPANIHANPLWGGDVAYFKCGSNPRADNEANVVQGVANLQSRGMRADVLDWPGPNQRGVNINPAVNPAVINGGIAENNLSAGMGWTVNNREITDGRFTVIAGDGVVYDPRGNVYRFINSDPNIGNMVVFAAAGAESLPYGGHVYSNISRGELISLIQRVNAEITKYGCGNGCRGANTWLWNGSNLEFNPSLDRLNGLTR